MAEVPAAFAAELAKIRNNYLAHLPVELEKLSDLASRLVGGDADRLLLVELHHRLHKLVGSGGILGLRQLSDRARVLEQLAKSWLDGEQKHSDPGARQNFIESVASLSNNLADVEAADSVDVDVIEKKTTGQDRQAYIWLVERDVQLGQELVRVLAQFGYEVRYFTCFDDAEKTADKERPDILIIDELLSQEGISATDYVQSSPRLKSLDCPLLFISDVGSFHSRIQAARLGAQGYLLKPLDIPKLIDRLEHILGNQQLATYRILIVDDDVMLGEHYRLVLSAAGMKVNAVSNPEEVIEQIAAFRPELVLMDMHMPGYSGPELAMVIRQYDEWLGLPIVYLSAETNMDEQLRALGHGADDFLTKPISDSQLVAAVNVRAARSRQLSDLMSKDSLTGLLKHARIKDELEIEIARAHRSGEPLCVAMVDIDHFKKVNDTYGHAAGDRVIRAVAQLLRQRLRKSDILGRYGGEEFAILLPACDIDAALALMDAVRQQFAELHFYHEGGEFSCTLSTGIACSNHILDSNCETMLAASDEALYQAKGSGRNRVCVSMVQVDNRDKGE